ncbi:hypothetical protein [Aromatoleum anaerobium]|uniref:Uncharacterized protein n=1 Tax=Aromatoleum anaerobium TaxID=182180 RepID=A0ABX1PQH1_9RHOO|nr:hypothetical protein [Aromatoleum anaerobium]MCK0508215.1 hypothetical protein [Aromatoleum anaerobium]
MNEIDRRSPYCLSPGIDVPTRDELLSLLSRSTLRGFYVDRAGDRAPARRGEAQQNEAAVDGTGWHRVSGEADEQGAQGCHADRDAWPGSPGCRVLSGEAVHESPDLDEAGWASCQGASQRAVSKL